MEIDLGGRKFTFAILIVCMAFALAIMGMITFEQFMNTAIWALGIFSASNAVATIAYQLGKKEEA